MISGNLDSPEGGFDGLLQAIVCQDVRVPVFKLSLDNLCIPDYRMEE